MAIITRHSTEGSTEVQAACRRETRSICVVTTSRYTSSLRYPHRKKVRRQSRSRDQKCAGGPSHAGTKVPVLPLRECHRETLLRPYCENQVRLSGEPFRQQIWSKQTIPEYAGPHVMRLTFLMFLQPHCMRIDLEPHMAIVMVEYPITSEKCFISPQDMCNETIICVLLLQHPFTEGHAFLTVIWFQTLNGCYRNGYSLSDRKSLSKVLLQYCIRLCYRQAAPRSSSIVKIGCWSDASLISQSVVQPTDDVDIRRTVGRISTGVLTSS
ncbi:uncharacterized protein TNCV_2164641 [Trichonephila clavipes]|nr:uncharacterized protein TNCV_2164641 [Trichonephila clavipes]